MMIISSFYVFIFLYFVSFFLVISCDDWFMMWLGLEINMMSFIVIVYKRYNQNSIESCLKYFFIQSLGSAIFLGLMYISNYMLSELVILVLSYKIGAAPMYYWYPSMMVGIDWVSCFILLSFQKIMPFMLMIMFSSWVIWFIIVLSLLMGVYGSFNQSNMKSLIAYSSIHHLGWIFLCNLYGDEVWMVYMLLYSIVIYVIVMVLLDNEVIYFHMISCNKNKLWFTFGMLSMGGMPPMLGFFLKWMAFSYIIKMNFFYLFFLIMMSVIMFYVYFRIVYDMYMYMSDKMCYLSYVNNINYMYMVDVFSVMGLFSGLIIILYFY